MVVRRREGEDLAHRVACQRFWRCALPLGGVLQRAGADDRALPGHQARHGVDGPDGAGVGQADRGAREVVDGELAGPGPAYQVLVGRPELREVHLVGVLDGRHEELARPVRLGQVDREPEVDPAGLDDRRLAVDLGVRGVHRGDGSRGLDDRPADEVGERDLAAAGAGQVVVDDDPVVDEQLGRDGPHGRRGRDGEAGLHVGHDPGGRAARARATRAWAGTTSAWWSAGCAIGGASPAGSATGGTARGAGRSDESGESESGLSGDRRLGGHGVHRRQTSRGRCGLQRPTRAAGARRRGLAGGCVVRLRALPSGGSRRPAGSRRRSPTRPGRRTPCQRGRPGTARRPATGWGRTRRRRLTRSRVRRRVLGWTRGAPLLVALGAAEAAG